MRRIALPLTVVLLSSVLAALPAGAVGDVSDTINIRVPSGANDPARLALRLSRETFPDNGADRVIVATDASFADALASGTLQGSDTPLLLTAPDDVRADVATEIQRLGASEVTLLGGTVALSDAVEEELADADLNVTRVAGPTRIETAVQVAALAPESSTAIISRAFAAGGDDSQAFADALSAGGWAADEGWPILLTSVDELSEPTRLAIADSPIERVMLLGGTAAVGPAIADELQELGIEVRRVAGASRFATAVEVARVRGFSSAADAEEIILAEGQATDAWAAGFAAAARSASRNAPIVLANGDDLPAETREFLLGNRTRVETENVTGPVLVCAAAAAACDIARDLLGLPTEAALTLDAEDDAVPSRSTLTGVLDVGDPDATVSAFGNCISDGLVVLDPDGLFAIDVIGTPGVCELEFEINFSNGSVQTIIRPITVLAAEPQSGVVINTETGGNSYTYVPDGANAPVDIPYTAADVFSVDGQDATIGAFEAAITVADLVTFSADTADGEVHALTNVDPSSLGTGTVGNVNLAAGTFAIIEPVSGAALRPALTLNDDLELFIGQSAVEREAFDADLSEGDRVVVDNDAVALSNGAADGTVGNVEVDEVSGIVRFTLGAFGDDPRNVEDDTFRLTGDTEAERYIVDGQIVSFEAFVAALSDGDDGAYTRVRGLQTIRLTNAAAPPVSGVVTEDFDPDGSPIAPEPEDGGDVTVLTVSGRRNLAYTSDATFSVDGQLATEAEFEASRTAGDRISIQVGDSATGSEEQVSLTNADLAGNLSDIAEGANTYDVVTSAGVVYDDLNYTQAVLGGGDVYVADGENIDLREFEDLLGLIDDGEQAATIVVRIDRGDTEHRLTFVD